MKEPKVQKRIDLEKLRAYDPQLALRVTAVLERLGKKIITVTDADIEQARLWLTAGKSTRSDGQSRRVAASRIVLKWIIENPRARHSFDDYLGTLEQEVAKLRTEPKKTRPRRARKEPVSTWPLASSSGTTATTVARPSRRSASTKKTRSSRQKRRVATAQSSSTPITTVT